MNLEVMQTAQEVLERIAPKPKVPFHKTKAHQRYITASGEEVPGATAILGVMDKGPGLLSWAYNCGLKGIDYRKVKDEAASIGSLAHFMSECFLKGDEPDISAFSGQDIEKATQSFLKFKEWWEEEEMTLVHSELQLVHDKLRYGGTLDLVARDRKNRLCLVDLKTSKAVYLDQYGPQVAGYDRLFQANRPGKEFHFERWMIVRIGKQDAGDFEVRAINATSIKRYWAVFDACRVLYYAKRACQ